MSDNATPGETQASGIVPRWVTVVVAFVAIGSYLVMVFVLYVQRGQAEQSWGRALSLYTGIQAVAFAAFGWALGTQVGQGAVAVAKGQAQREGQRADAAQEVAAQARADQAVQSVKTDEAHDRGETLAAHLRDQELQAARAGAGAEIGNATEPVPAPAPAFSCPARVRRQDGRGGTTQTFGAGSRRGGRARRPVGLRPCGRRGLGARAPGRQARRSEAPGR